MDIFAGNLAFEAKDADVYRLFMPFGSVSYVSVVMDKKGKNSRGFCFLVMPNEEEAQAAIAALDKKEFMGRPLNVEQARSKPGDRKDNKRKEKVHLEVRAEIKPLPREEKDPRLSLSYNRKPWQKQGRRSRSFLRRRAEAGNAEPAEPHRRNFNNPMRWQKKKAGVKPWQKNRGEIKPWEKTEGDSGFQDKLQEGSRPWRKSNKGAGPGQKDGMKKRYGNKRPAWAGRKQQ